MRRALLVLLLLALAAAAPLAHDSRTAASPPRPEYLALGDSLAASMQPDSTGEDRPTNQGYAEGVWKARAHAAPSLELLKLGRGGETAASMVSSDQSGPSQLEQAENELRGGSVVLVTIDIGANEVERCTTGAGFDAACVSRGLASLRASLPRIIKRLRAAGATNIPIVGVNYYNSFLGRWVTGGSGRRLALASVPVERSINATLAQIYRAAHIPVADVESSFQTRALSRWVNTSAFGRVPLAVARTCRWTWACSARYDDHTNAAGYRVITQTVLATLRAEHR